MRAQQSPALLSAQVVRALGAPASDPERAAQVEALAVQLARRLRTEGKLSAALEVAAAGRRRTAGLRMEEALAAFALGRDDIATSVTLEDARVAAVVGPLVRAARGEKAAGARARGAPRELHALQAAARAVGYAVGGDTDKARGVLRRIDRTLRAQVFGPELEAVLDLATPVRARRAVFRLGRSAVVRTQGSVRRAVLEEAAAYGATEVVEDLDTTFAFAPPEERRVAGVRAARARLLSRRSPAAAMEAMRHLDPGMFAATEQGVAALYKGFGLLTDAPRAAARAFDQAIERGGDLIEALRGKLLAAIITLEEQDAASSREQERQARDVATAAWRLARALEQGARVGPLVAAAASIAAVAWVNAGDGAAAEAAIARARAAAGSSAALDRIEIAAIGLRDPTAARARVDALLARDRTEVSAWHLKIGLAQTLQERDAALIEAAAATGDPELVEAANAIAREGDEEDGDDAAMDLLEGAFAHLTPREQEALEQEMMEIVSRPPTRRGTARLVKLLMSMVPETKGAG